MAGSGLEQQNAVLRLWFEEHGLDDWFAKSDEFDSKIRDRFLKVYEQAAAGGLQDWRDTPRGCLALCLVLDQFPRNLFRDDPRAFATDAMARELTRHVLDRGFDRDPAHYRTGRWFRRLGMRASRGSHNTMSTMMRTQVQTD